MGGTNLFNKSELFKNSTDPIFIVEGEIDAMSIVEVGGKAVGLGSIGNINKLINLISDLKVDRTFILSLDQDEKGREAELKLAEQFRSKKIKFISYKLTIDDVKDPNEMLVKNKGVKVKKNGILNIQQLIIFRSFLMVLRMVLIIHVLKQILMV